MAESTQVLRFMREGEYSNTRDRFRVYEFTADCPTVVARHDASPPHAVAGDQLWVEDDELTPYRLKRNGKEIGSRINSSAHRDRFCPGARGRIGSCTLFSQRSCLRAVGAPRCLGCRSATWPSSGKWSCIGRTNIAG